MKRLFTLCGAALALVLSLGAVPARAASFVVTTLADSGAGSLRQAILDANANPGADVITFSVSGTITLLSVLDIRDTMTITGTGQTVTISGGNAVQVMTAALAPAATVLTLDSLTLANGLGSLSVRAAGVDMGSASLTVTNSVFSNHTGGNSSAGAIASSSNTSTLTVRNSRFTGNSGSNASAVYSSATTVITDSTFDSNVGPSSALLANGSGTTLTISGSTFSGNAATNACCGAVLAGVPGTITNSTFSGNSSAGQAGALGAGGGNPGLLTVTNSTFSGNVSGLGGAITGNSNPSIALRNTIVANSTGGNCSVGIIDGGGNLSDDAISSATTPSAASPPPPA